MVRRPKIEICPFTILVDVNEGAPFRFDQIDHRTKHTPLLVETETMALWSLNRRDVEVKGETFQVGLADYTIRGFEDRIQVERKSLEDLFGTLGHRRKRFEAEVKRLHEDCQFASIVVEGSWAQIYRWRGHGAHYRSVLMTISAWQQRDPRVHWNLYPSRAAAEKMTFRMLERFWLDQQEAN